MQKLHQTDVRDFALIDDAAYFIASIFLGTGQFDKSEQSDLETARAVASQMSQHYKNGRLGMVYAILPNGRSVFVPDTYQPKERKMSDADAGIPAFLKKDKLAETAKPEATAKAPKAKKAKAAKPANGSKQISRGVLTEKGKKANTKPANKPAAKAKPVVKAPKAKTATAPRPAGGKRGAILAAAQRGEMPTPPDFSADSHVRYRGKLAELVALAKAGDVKGLKAFEIKAYSSSPQAMDRYRNLAVMALEARAKR